MHESKERFPAWQYLIKGPVLEPSGALHYGQGVRAARREEEKEAERLYEEAVGEATREVSSEEVPGEMPDGEANR